MYRFEGVFVAMVIVSVVLAVLLGWAAVRKLSHREAVVASYARLGVPEDKLNYLAFVLLAGAAGVIAGLVWAPIGVVATIGVVCYFVGAVVFHLRAREFRTVSTPIAFAVVAAAALALRLTS